MNTIRKIAVFTSIRSEYGPLLPLLQKLKNDPAFELRLLVGGAHLLEEYGMTIDQIRADGFEITQLFPFICIENRPDAEAQSMATLQQQMGSYLGQHKPDLMLLVGDRFELLPVVNACLVMSIPVAHISGGDVTEGAIDNQIRHAVTKMSHLHFPATQLYKQNLLKMGEEEWRICVAGEPGLDQIASLDYISKEKLFSDLGLSLHKPVLFCTFHPETIDNMITPSFVTSLLEKIISENKYQVITTASNFDQGGSSINVALEMLSKQNPTVLHYVKNLGQRRYYSLLRHTAIMIGNSSGGLTEAQSFNIPVINIGKRQQGRLANKNVLHVPTNVSEIMESLSIAVSENFKLKYNGLPNIYGDGRSTGRIIEFLKNIPAEKNLLMKKSVF